MLFCLFVCLFACFVVVFVVVYTVVIFCWKFGLTLTATKAALFCSNFTKHIRNCLCSMTVPQLAFFEKKQSKFSMENCKQCKIQKSCRTNCKICVCVCVCVCVMYFCCTIDFPREKNTVKFMSVPISTFSALHFLHI